MRHRVAGREKKGTSRSPPRGRKPCLRREGLREPAGESPGPGGPVPYPHTPVGQMAVA